MISREKGDIVEFIGALGEADHPCRGVPSLNLCNPPKGNKTKTCFSITFYFQAFAVKVCQVINKTGLHVGEINIYETAGTCTQEQIPRVGGKVSQSTNRADAEDER